MDHQHSTDGISNYRLYLGNLPRNTTKPDVEKHFQKHAHAIDEIKLMTGFGFIDFNDADVASDAKNVYHSTNFNGLPMHVQFARGPRRPDSSAKSEELYAHLPARPRPFFQTGKVIKVLWEEPAGESAEPKGSSGIQRTPGVRIFEIPGFLNGNSTNALGDYGAKKNFVNEAYARRIGLKIDRNVTSNVIVGSGKTVHTTGIAAANFDFRGEIMHRVLVFHLLPNCIHDVILGKPFLKATKTFSNLTYFAQRVKEKVMKGVSKLQMLYLGESSPKFQGFVNGKPGFALADTGAKVSIVDEDWALRNGLKVNRGFEHRERLRFADDSKAWTSGMAFGVEWRFGSCMDSTPHHMDFYVLKNAPAEVILCDTFLFDNHAFSRYQDCLIDDDDDDDSSCFAIDRDTSPSSEPCKPMSATQMEFHELVRRGREDDRIINLPRCEQEAARLAEDDRRATWDRQLVELQRRASRPPQVLLSSSTQLFPHTSDPPVIPATQPPSTSTTLPANPFTTLSSGKKMSYKRLKKLFRIGE